MKGIDDIDFVHTTNSPMSSEFYAREAGGIYKVRRPVDFSGSRKSWVDKGIFEPTHISKIAEEGVDPNKVYVDFVGEPNYSNTLMNMAIKKPISYKGKIYTDPEELNKAVVSSALKKSEGWEAVNNAKEKKFQDMALDVWREDPSSDKAKRLMKISEFYGTRALPSKLPEKFIPRNTVPEETKRALIESNINPFKMGYAHFLIPGKRGEKVLDFAEKADVNVYQDFHSPGSGIPEFGYSLFNGLK
jgi:hypothetical protein